MAATIRHITGTTPARPHPTGGGETRRAMRTGPDGATRAGTRHSLRSRLRAGLAGLALALLAQPAAAAVTELDICMQARGSAGSYAAAFRKQGWMSLASDQQGYEAVLSTTGEILWTLRRFPISFAAAEDVHGFLDEATAHARARATSHDSAVLVKNDLSLLILMENRGPDRRLTCTLVGRSIPDVAARLPEPGRNPSGEPLAWNVISSGPLDTPHIFAEIMYVRLFFQPAQHLLTGGDAIVSHLTFRREATAT